MTDTIRCVFKTHAKRANLGSRCLRIPGLRCWRSIPGMTHGSLFDAATARTEIAR
ncbi:MAG: hypothetical protein MZV49_09940 [Rhodopseudomonas palustris]|nr:hypothetical protein [Rhodopseudomonas palustris]